MKEWYFQLNIGTDLTDDLLKRLQRWGLKVSAHTTNAHNSCRVEGIKMVLSRSPEEEQAYLTKRLGVPVQLFGIQVYARPWEERHGPDVHVGPQAGNLVRAEYNPFWDQDDAHEL